MSRTCRYVFSAVAAVAILAAAGTGSAQDFELARDAVERGEILPLAKLLPQIEKDYSGKVIEVELEIAQGSKVYEFEVLTNSGQLLEVDVDAASGKVLSVGEED